MKTILFTLLFFATFFIAKAQVTTVNAVLANPCAVLNTQDFQTQIDFTIYPNPSDGIVNIKVNSSTNINNPKIVIYSMNGMLIYESKFENNQNHFEKSLPLQNLSNGIYLLSLVSNQEKITKKLIINK